ncbi:MAG: hypothetical protein WA609_02510 [Terriglobales bacterium]
MRRLALCFLLFALAANCVAREETVAELKARLESARPEDRPEICVQIARLELRAADKLYGEGHVDEARADVEDVATYFEKARDAAIESKKHLKNVEINGRKTSEKLRDMKRTLAFEDQAPVEKAIRQIEDVRTALLNEMFSEKKKGRK